MEKSTQMPKIDMAKEFASLNESDKHFVKKLEEMNMKRAKDIKNMRFRNKITGALLGVGVLGIYFYTMSAVKQEKFLDFEDPPPQTGATANKS